MIYFIIISFAINLLSITIAIYSLKESKKSNNRWRISRKINIDKGFKIVSV